MIDTSLIIAYILIVLLLGYFSGRKQTKGDFMIAERKLGMFSFVGTVVASSIGAGFLVVYTSFIFEFGIGTMLAILGYGLGFISFGLVGKKLRKLAYENNFHTVADFFHFAYGKKSGHLMAVIIFVIFIFLTLIQFVGGTQVLSAISGYSYEVSLFISASVVFIYLMLGGFRSVIRTDVFQYLVLLVLILVVGYIMVGEADLKLESFTKTSINISQAIFFFIYGLLAVWTAADTWQRVYAAKNDKIVSKGFIVVGIFLLIIGFGITMIGLSAKVAFPDIDPSQAFVYGITNLLPHGIVGLAVILAFAAVMSSADTNIFVLSTALAKDFVSKIRKEKLTQEKLVSYTRINLVIITLLCTVLTYIFRDLVDLSLIMAGLSMVVVPAIIASLKWKIKENAIIYSAIAGLLYLLFWIYIGNVTPETMISAFIPAGIILFMSQKLSRR